MDTPHKSTAMADRLPLKSTTASGSMSAAAIRAALDSMSTPMHGGAIAEFYARMNEASGNPLVLRPEYGYLPLLMGHDGQPVFLYHFVEALDGAVDYAQLQEAFPTLSYGQIGRAIAFLRKLAQFNTNDLDLDRLEDELMEGNPDFQAELAQAVQQQEGRRVLDAQHREGG